MYSDRKTQVGYAITCPRGYSVKLVGGQVKTGKSLLYSENYKAADSFLSCVHSSSSAQSLKNVYVMITLKCI